MIYPQEIEVWYILPAIRREISKSLVKNGLTQKNIALRLGITESAVSQYLKEKRASEIKFDDNVLDAIKKSSKKIAKNENVMKEIERIIHLMKKTKFICKIHHRYDHSLPENCDNCIYEK